MVGCKFYRFLLLVAFSILMASCDSATDPNTSPFNLGFDYSGSQSGSFLLFHTPPDTTAVIYSGSGDSSYSVEGIRWKDGHRHADIFILSFHNPDKLTSGMILSTENPQTTIKVQFGINSAMTTIHKGTSYYFAIADSSQYEVKSMTVRILEYKPVTRENPFDYSYHIEFFGILINSKGEQVTISNGSMIDRSF